MKLFQKIALAFRWYFLKKKGYSNYYISFYSDELKSGLKDKSFSLKERKWAYKRGFQPWRIKQYGLTEENYKNIMSDRDYFYLYPINNHYSSWVDDKLSMKYVLAPFDRFLPRYYFHIMKDRDIMKLMDCPEELGHDAGSIVSLLESKGQLAAKMSAGTYGIGFYKLEYKDSEYFANGEKYDRNSFEKFLLSLDDYIITEFIEMHPELKKINPGAVNTIRVTVINEHGNDTIIPFAFMRIGTKRSGVVDNVSKGGMVCKIDVGTGRFYDGQVLKDHVYENVEYHPDTHERLEGILPNWELVKKTLLEMSRYCPQLKWLGYDIAITADGFSIIEINSHHGLHKAHEYPEAVNKFLFSELEKKKKKYNVK